jgi:hypothetical protein
LSIAGPWAFAAVFGNAFAAAARMAAVSSRTGVESEASVLACPGRAQALGDFGFFGFLLGGQRCR